MRPEEKPCDGGTPLGRVARMLKTGSRYLIPTRRVNASPGAGRRAESAVAFRIHPSQDKDNSGISLLRRRCLRYPAFVAYTLPRMISVCDMRET
jgi:hypothetical protein